MTGNEMITSLQYRLEDDTSNTNFSEAQKLVALNDAQRQVVALCSNEALVHLQTSRAMGSTTSDSDHGGLIYFSLPTTTNIFTGVTCTASNGRFVTSSDNGFATGDTVTLTDFLKVSDDAAYTAINGLTSQITVLSTTTFTVDGVVQEAITENLDSGTVEKVDKPMTRVVSVYDDTNNRFVELTSIQGLGGNTSYNYGTKGAFFANRFYVTSSDTVSDCTLVYITSPSDITASATEITYLSDSVQQAVLEMAESLLWRQDNRQQRAQGAHQNSMALISAINMGE